ncbi:hypothetical protein EDD15DRAFT_2373237 [Pisolithus albus]|nr:hypothetical protein EDD15DRAFT_2373237 [Pisolithus albus]
MSNQPAEDKRHPHVQPADPLVPLQDDGLIRPPTAPTSLGLADGPQASRSWYQQHPPDGGDQVSSPPALHLVRFDPVRGTETHPVTVQPMLPTVHVPPSHSRSSRTDTQETYHPVLRSPTPSLVPLDDQHPEQLGPSHSPTPLAPRNVGQTPAMPPLGQIHPPRQEPMVAHEPYPMGASMGHSAVPPTIPIGGTSPLIPMADLRSPHEHGMMEMPASPRRTHPTPQQELSTQLPSEPPVIFPGLPSTYSPRVVTLPSRTYDYDYDEYYYPSRRRYYCYESCLSDESGKTSRPRQSSDEGTRAETNQQPTQGRTNNGEGSRRADAQTEGDDDKPKRG